MITKQKIIPLLDTINMGPTGTAIAGQLLRQVKSNRRLPFTEVTLKTERVLKKLLSTTMSIYIHMESIKLNSKRIYGQEPNTKWHLITPKIL